MNNDNQRVIMRYEGDREQRDKLECIFTYNGKEYRLMYYHMSIFAGLFNMPQEVREYILQWAKMLSDPD